LFVFMVLGNCFLFADCIIEAPAPHQVTCQATFLFSTKIFTNISYKSSWYSNYN
jgi:hypothetical protein